MYSTKLEFCFNCNDGPQETNQLIQEGTLRASYSLEKEMRRLGRFLAGDIFVWDIKTDGNPPVIAHGTVNWLRLANNDPVPRKGRIMWHDSNIGEGDRPFPPKQLFDVLQGIEVYFDAAGRGSFDGSDWVTMESFELELVVRFTAAKSWA